jgi:hypothetical protein
MSSDHAPLWITPSHRLKARFVATYRLRLRGDAQRRRGRGSSARSEASAESVCQAAATEQKTVDNQFGKRLIPNSYEVH